MVAVSDFKINKKFRFRVNTPYFNYLLVDIIRKISALVKAFVQSAIDRLEQIGQQRPVLGEDFHILRHSRRDRTAGGIVADITSIELDDPFVVRLTLIIE